MTKKCSLNDNITKMTLKQFKQFLKTLIRTKYLKSKEDIKKFIIDIWLLHINKNSLLST